MSSIKNEYNPLSIENQVKRRIELRSNGVTVPDSHHQTQTPNRSRSAMFASSPAPKEDDLSIHFMNLLFSNEAPSNNRQAAENGHQESAEVFKKTGTNKFFYPLKKREESIFPSTTQMNNFSLVIENAEAGAVTLNGRWERGMMKVQLQISKPLEAQEKQILVAILTKKLSHELGIHMEVEID